MCLIRYNLDIPNVLMTCKNCGDINYLNSKALGSVTEFSFKCRYCNKINRIILEDGELNLKTRIVS
jgi:RNase P subunit RPR2